MNKENRGNKHLFIENGHEISKSCNARTFEKKRGFPSPLIFLFHFQFFFELFQFISLKHRSLGSSESEGFVVTIFGDFLVKFFVRWIMMSLLRNSVFLPFCLFFSVAERDFSFTRRGIAFLSLIWANIFESVRLQ